MPKYLFHYTTIDTLALILKYKSIRFNSLKNVDDLEEQESADLSNFGKFCFASCWTADENENIALWNMYSKNGTGIRIQLPASPFKKNTVIINDNPSNTIETHYKSITINDVNGHCVFNFFPCQEVNLSPVYYTDNESLKKPNIFHQEENRISIDWSLLGNIKSSLWSFQKEWRFSFCTTPSQIPILSFKGFTIKQISQFCEHTTPPFEYYDISIDDKCFSEMKILMGPSTTESDLTIVHSLVKTFNPTAEIEPSHLKNTIRLKH